MIQQKNIRKRSKDTINCKKCSSPNTRVDSGNQQHVCKACGFKWDFMQPIYMPDCAKVPFIETPAGDKIPVLRDVWHFPSLQREIMRDPIHSLYKYTGRYFPIIARLLIHSFTREKDWVYDPTFGSGTTLIEAFRLNRNSFGTDISLEAFNLMLEKIAKLKRLRETNVFEVDDEEEWMPAIGVEMWDARELSMAPWFTMPMTIDNVVVTRLEPQLVITSPPWYKITTFSEKKECLEQSKDYEEWLANWIIILTEIKRVLKDYGYIACIMGDNWHKGKKYWICAHTMVALESLGFEPQFYAPSTLRPNFDDGVFPKWRERVGNKMAFKKIPALTHETIIVAQKVRGEGSGFFDIKRSVINKMMNISDKLER